MNSDHILPGTNRTLIAAAVPAERDAVLRGLRDDPRFEVINAGVGPIASAANTARALAADQYGLVISAGIGGGFPGKAEVGSLVVASEIVAADLGVETPEGFSSIDELGFGATRISVESGLFRRVVGTLQAAGLEVCTGPVLTVSTVTGTAESAARLAARVPGAVAEAMEGYGVALAALLYGIPTIEIRAVSNLVGPRNRAVWRVEEALRVLEAAGSILKEVL